MSDPAFRYLVFTEDGTIYGTNNTNHAQTISGFDVVIDVISGSNLSFGDSLADKIHEVKPSDFSRDLSDD